MDKLITVMDFSTIKKSQPKISQRFRPPTRAEQALGLWVDRIGIAKSENIGDLRILGLYAAVHVLNGQGQYYNEASGTHSVAAGDTLLVFPDEAFAYGPHEKWDSLWIVWTGPEAENLEKSGYLDRKNPIVHDRQEAALAAHSALHPLMDDEDRIALLARKCAILNMILALNRQSKSPAAKKNSSIDRALTLIKSRASGDLPIPELAESCGLSETHFRRLFKAHTGASPQEFMAALRIGRAKEMLGEGRSIKETAASLGFRDVFYFMRLFKKISGVSPGRFEG